MDKALEIGKVSAAGSLQLFIGKTVSTVILAVGTTILGLFIQVEDYGLYTIALIPATTLILFQDWGVGSAMTKYCAQYRSMNKEEDLRKIILAGEIFESVTGIILTIISLLTANSLASTIFGKPELASLIIFSSITILFAALFNAAQSVFVGFERMKLSSYTIICQATSQCVLSPLLVYLGYGALGAILGYTFSFLVAGVVATVLLYFAIFRKLRGTTTSKSNASQALKPLLRYGVPLAIGTILGGILTSFYSFIMASFVDVAMIGNYRIAANFAILLAFFTVPISTVLFPAFSKLNPRNEQQLLKTVFTSSVKYTALFLVPATMAMAVLSEPIIGTLYGSKWLSAPSFLALYVITNLFVIFGSLSTGSLLSGLGETRMLMKLNVLTLLVGVPLAFLLIPTLGIVGVILVNMIAGLPSMFWGLYWIWKHYEAKADFKSSGRIFIVSLIAFTMTYVFINSFKAAEWIRLTIGGIIFLVSYVVSAPITGAITQSDIYNLRTMFSGLGFISKLISIPLGLIEKLRLFTVHRKR